MHLADVGQRVAGGQQHALELHQRLPEPQAGRGHRVPDEADVDRALGQGGHLVGGPDLGGREADTGVGGAETGDERGDHGGGQVGRDADLEHGALAVPGQLVQPVDAGDDLAGLGQQHASGLGEAHLAGRAVEQPGAEFLLQTFDALAERRLGHAEPDRGVAEVKVLRHRDEVAKMADEVHDQLLYPDLYC